MRTSIFLILLLSLSAQAKNGELPTNAGADGPKPTTQFPGPVSRSDQLPMGPPPNVPTQQPQHSPIGMPFPLPYQPQQQPPQGPSDEEKRIEAAQLEQARIEKLSEHTLRLQAKAQGYEAASSSVISKIDTDLTRLDTRAQTSKSDYQSRSDTLSTFEADVKHLRDTGERYDPSKSPSLQRSYPEMVLVPLAQRALLPLAEAIVDIGEIGASLAGLKDLNGYPRIRTPFRDPEQGLFAKQDITPEGLAIRKMVEEDGALLYRLGLRGKSFTGKDVAYYGLRNPLTFEGYGPKHSMPSQNVKDANFIELAKIKQGADFIVRRIARFTDPLTGEVYEGGEWEVIVPKGQGSAQINGHFSK